MHAIGLQCRVPHVFLAILTAAFKDRADLVAENLGLRHQLACLAKDRKRPKLRPTDRVLWALLARWWSRWREALVMVKPATVIAWQRKGFRLFWRWKSRPRRSGRPPITAEIRKLIEEMARTNVGWGAPRIHGELRKLGIRVSEATVSRYMPKRAARRDRISDGRRFSTTICARPWRSTSPWCRRSRSD